MVNQEDIAELLRSAAYSITSTIKGLTVLYQYVPDPDQEDLDKALKCCVDAVGYLADISGGIA